jgi:hypothetical protein
VALRVRHQQIVFQAKPTAIMLQLLHPVDLERMPNLGEFRVRVVPEDHAPPIVHETVPAGEQCLKFVLDRLEVHG